MQRDTRWLVINGLFIIFALLTLSIIASVWLGGQITHGDMLAFVSDRDDSREIYVTDISKRITYPLTWDGATATDPVWSPDGESIAYTTMVESTSHIYVMDVARGRLHSLTEGISEGALSPAWSPDGTQIAFIAQNDGAFDVYIAEVATGAITNLTQSPHNEVMPIWSPDATYLAFVGMVEERFNLQTLRMADMQLTTLATTKSFNYGHVSWSPDSQQIVFPTESGYFRDLYIVDAAGGNLHNLTRNNSQGTVPVWSPDGERIAFAAVNDKNRDVYLLHIPTGQVTNLTDHEASDGFPIWSPDGTHIMFWSDRDGNGEIYLMDTEGRNLRNLTQHASFDFSPTWRP